MSAENHDGIFSAVSHLPHLLAFAYFSSVASQPAGRDFLSLAGPGFRDFTRIAASNSEVWRDILIANRTELFNQLDLFKQALARFEGMMKSADADALESVIREVSDGRGAWHLNNSKVSTTGNR